MKLNFRKVQTLPEVLIPGTVYYVDDLKTQIIAETESTYIVYDTGTADWNLEENKIGGIKNRTHYYNPDGTIGKQLDAEFISDEYTNTLKHWVEKESEIKTSLSDEISRATAAENAIKNQIDDLYDITEEDPGDSGKSIRTIAYEEVSKIVDSAPESFDTLKEIADYIESDETHAGNIAYQLDDHADRISDLETDSVIIKGDADNSAVLKGEYEGYSNNAISQVSFAVGAATMSGLKGWYYSAIDFINKKITLSDKPTYILAGSILLNGGWSSGTPNIKVNDVISLVNNSKYDLCSKVTAVNGNVITVDSLPFTGLVKDSGAAAAVIAGQFSDGYSLYIPERPDAGIIDFGGGAFSAGGQSKATNICAHAEGLQTHAYGQYSHTEGRETKAGYAAHAEGRDTKAKGERSHAEGDTTISSGQGSHSEGKLTESSGAFSHAEGTYTKASGKASHVEGLGTQDTLVEATGEGAHAEGRRTKALNNGAHAEGTNNETKSPDSHVEGANNKIDSGASCAHSEGATNTTKTGAQFSHIEGVYNSVSGEAAHAEGNSTESTGSCAHAEGLGTKAIGKNSHAEGEKTVAYGQDTHAEGLRLIALGSFSHAEGGGFRDRDSIPTDKSTIESEWDDATQRNDVTNNGENSRFSASVGDLSHAEGITTLALGNYSHSEGEATKAKGRASHAEGYYTETTNTGEHASGRYNKSTNSSDAAKATKFSIGIGSSLSDRKNAVEVKLNGDVYINGIGGFTGANSDSAKSVQEVINDLVNKLNEITTND